MARTCRGQNSTQNPHPLQRSSMMRTSPRGTGMRSRSNGCRQNFMAPSLLTIGQPAAVSCLGSGPAACALLTRQPINAVSRGTPTITNVDHTRNVDGRQIVGVRSCQGDRQVVKLGCVAPDGQPRFRLSRGAEMKLRFRLNGSKRSKRDQNGTSDDSQTRPVIGITGSGSNIRCTGGGILHKRRPGKYCHGRPCRPTGPGLW